MLKKRLVRILTIMLTVFCLPGCGAAPAANTTANVPETTTQTVPPETTEPDDGSIKFYYDDRISPTEFGGAEGSVIQILDQQIDSCKVGTSDPDDAILYFDETSGQYIAVGVGTATLDVDGKQVLIRVKPAPISLFMITGHSIGAGQCGVAAQSVQCEAGQAYSCHKPATFQGATEDMGIGYASAVKPQGIDAFAPGGGGTIGEGSGIAFKWNQLTGEKVWVLNAAKGGSVIPEWQKGGEFYEPAVAMYRAAALVLKNEIAAGHYLLKNTAIIYHSAANFEYKNVEYTDEVMEFWYDSMYNGFLEDLAMDINGDGEKETVQCLGFIPIWSNAKKGSYVHDKPINFYMALSDAYPGCFIVGETMRNWCTDTLLNENFPAIEYTTQSEPVELPSNKESMHAEDGVHYTQVVYNAAGLELGENLYNYFRTKAEPEEIVIYTTAGLGVKDTLKFKKVGSTHTLVAEVTPCYVADFTIELSENLELISPFTVKAKAEGDGYILISRNGKEIRKINVTVGD